MIRAAMLKPRLRALFEDYADFHRHPTNRLTHEIAIPLIVFHIVAMLDWVTLARVPQLPGGRLTLAMLAYVASVAWYASLDGRLALVMAALYALAFPLGRLAPVWVVVAAAVVGWGVQLAGHSIWEKRRPAFVTNLLQALVGPLFFVARVTGDWPERR